jgi:hypothetical protein
MRWGTTAAIGTMQRRRLCGKAPCTWDQAFAVDSALEPPWEMALDTALAAALPLVAMALATALATALLSPASERRRSLRRHKAGAGRPFQAGWPHCKWDSATEGPT